MKRAHQLVIHPRLHTNVVSQLAQLEPDTIDLHSIAHPTATCNRIKRSHTIDAFCDTLFALKQREADTIPAQRMDKKKTKSLHTREMH